MTRFVLPILCFLILLGGLTAHSELEANKSVPQLLTPELFDKPATTHGPPAVGKLFSVELGGLSGALSGLRADEQPEQLADWAMYGTLLYAGMTPEELREATFDKSPLRLPSLDETVNFDYGPGRRVLLRDDSAWLFYNEKDTRRRVTLARLADQSRMELGKIPARFLVFRYQVAGSADSPSLSIVREADIGGPEMFTPISGYIEARVASKEQLEEWLKSVDDLTHVDFSNKDVLILGGRRFDEARTPGLALDDIVALFQAHIALGGAAEPGFSLDPKWDLKRLLEDLQRVLASPKVENFSAMAYRTLDDNKQRQFNETSMPVGVLAARQVLEAIAKRSPDQTLHPDWLKRIDAVHKELSEVFDQAKAVQWRSGNTVAEDGNVLPLIKLREELRTLIKSINDRAILPSGEWSESALSEGDRQTASDAALAMSILDLLEARHRSQCARYDGPLKGTRVGMNLFYTDLMAKIWESVDYHRAAPIKEVPGFYSKPLTGGEIEPLYWEELHRLNGTRLWFGTRAEGYATDGSGDRFSFAHIATRVFAKGSNQLKPGEESAPNEHSRRALSWWDRHYAQIADYEPQYHLQNQIMKWSIVTGLMAERHQEALGHAETSAFWYLKPLVPENSLRFDSWYRDNASLRFKEDIRFRPEALWLGETECIEILRSYDFPHAGGTGYIAGGVSLGGSRALQTGTRISSSAASSLRRGGVNYNSSSFAGSNRALSFLPRALRPSNRLTALKGTTFELPTIARSGRAMVSMDVAAGTRLRHGGLELQARTLHTDIRLGAQSGRLSLQAGETRLAALRFERTAQGLRLRAGADQLALPGGASSSALEEATLPYSLKGAMGSGPRVSFDVETAAGVRTRYMAQDPATAALHPEQSFVAVSRAVEGQQSAPNLMMRTATIGNGRGVTTYEMAPVRSVDLRAALNKAPWQRLRTFAETEAADGERFIERTFTSSAPPSGGRAVRIELGDPALPHVDGVIADGALHLQRPATLSPAAQRTWNYLPQRTELRGVAIERLVKSANAAPAEVAPLRTTAAELRGELTSRVAQKVQRGDLSSLLDELSSAQREGKMSSVAAEIQRARTAYAAPRPESLPEALSDAARGAKLEDGKLLGKFNADASLGDAISQPVATVKGAPVAADFSKPAAGFRPSQLQKATPEIAPSAASTPRTSSSPTADNITRTAANGNNLSGTPRANPISCEQLRRAGLLPRGELLRCCDLNHDGQLALIEQVACCDRNFDGKLQADEEQACKLP